MGQPRRVHPGALVAAVLALGVGGCGGADERGDAPFAGAPIVIVSIDTLRADALSMGGGPAGISPTLEAFAREAIVFEHARAQAPHTAPSHMSLFTSLYPSMHDVQNVMRVTDPVTGKEGPVILELPEGIPTLAEVLHGAGYRTAALTEGGNVGPAHGFARGFDAYRGERIGAAAGAQLAAQLLAQEVHGEAPLFLFWHTYETHAPYVPPSSLRRQWTSGDYDGPMRAVTERLEGGSVQRNWRLWHTAFEAERSQLGPADAEYMRGLYHGEVAYTDAVLSALLSALRQHRLLEEAIVVVLSDHGEEFHEHGSWQHMQLYEECLRVPLIVRLPGGRGGGRCIATPVALIDVMPTLLELVGVDPAGVPGLAMQGRSFAPALLDGTEPPARPITSELRWDRAGAAAPRRQVAHHHAGRKLIVDELAAETGAPAVQVFDLAADPGETDPLPPDADAARPLLELHRAWEALVAAHRPGRAAEAPVELDAEQIEQLVELGYLGEGEDGGGR